MESEWKIKVDGACTKGGRWVDKVDGGWDGM